VQSLLTGVFSIFSFALLFLYGGRLAVVATVLAAVAASVSGVCGWAQVRYRSFFWDGRVATLEEQVLRPIERDGPAGGRGRHACPSCAGRDRARPGQLPPVDPFRRLTVRPLYINGDRAALTLEQQAGLRLLRGKANCSSCHVGPNFTDESLHNTGVSWRDGRLTDAGGRSGQLQDTHTP
jgi:hypothetical protein